MTLYCVACTQPATSSQPYYCESCFIPIPPYDQGEYIGNETAFCPECATAMTASRDYCRNCNHQPSFFDPPLPAELSRDMKIREENRVKLAQDVLADNRMTQQVIEMLGIDHLPREQQGVALTALAREKMNFLSVEYNMVEAHTLVDMGHAIAENTGVAWATQLTGMRLANIYYRKGMALQAVKLLTEIFQTAPQETEIQQFRKIEVLAHLALAHRLAGNAKLADEVAHQAHEQTLAMYQQMEQTIHKMIEERSSISQFIGLDEANANYPRVDYIFTILVVLAEEALSRGPQGKLKIQELALDRLMELDNIVKILANISPDDDTTFFASHLRDYVRIFNGVLWYGDLLLPNAHTRRRFLIEQYYERIHQWTFLIPAQYWLSLRPARFFDIFLRASSWAKFSADDLTTHLFDLSPDQIKAQWHYIRADAYAKIGRIEDAITELQVVLQDKEPYMAHADDELRNISQQLYNSIHLESIGLITNLASIESDWMILPLSIQMEEIANWMEPESYLQEFKSKPILRMVFEEPPSDGQIAVFGEKLLEAYTCYPVIERVGDRDYRSNEWESSGAEGIKTDVVVLRSELATQSLTLLFEGQPQEVVQGQLQPSALLVLRGIIHQQPMNYEELTDTLIDLLTEPEEAAQHTQLFTLKQPELDEKNENE